VSIVHSGQRGGAAFTPVAPPSRQRSRVIERQHSSDSVIGNNTIRMVNGRFLYMHQFILHFLIAVFYELDFLLQLSSKFGADICSDMANVFMFQFV